MTTTYDKDGAYIEVTEDGAVYRRLIRWTDCVVSVPNGSNLKVDSVYVNGSSQLVLVLEDDSEITVTGGGAGDMDKATYDPDDDGVIAAAQLDPDVLTATEHTAIGDSTPHHTRYADAEAVSAMGAKANSNPLNHDRLALGTSPSTQAFGDTAAGGSATDAAKTDHKHAMPANPVTGHESTYDHSKIHSQNTDTDLDSTFEATFEKVANKGAASGYASLSAATKVVEQPASISDHLEGTPTEDLSTKAPTSEYMFDHNASLTAHNSLVWAITFGG